MNADGTSAGDPSFQRFHGSFRGAFVAPRASVAIAGFVVECSRGYNARDLGCESGCEFLRVRVCAVLTSHGGIWGKALYARALFSIPRPPDRRTWKEMLRGGMAEEILNDSLADLREVENKVGRKTPESLLIWMRDAADCGDGWWSDVVDRGDRSSAFGQSFSDKIRGLKQEMRLLRSADVKILRQLVTVHEGIEAMRWLMEERGASTSRGSSLAGSLSSLSSLVAVEEHGLPLPPCRESQSPSQDLTEDSGEESAGHPPHADDAESNHNGDLRIPESTGEKPPRPRLKFQVTHGSDRRSSPGLANFFVDAKLQKSRPQGSKVAPSQDLEKNAGTIRRALLRSHKARSAKDIFSLTKPSEETPTQQQTQSFRVSRHDAKKEEEVAPNGDTSLLGYDAQWCWVDSQDEITYL